MDTNENINESIEQKSLRIWPGIVLVTFQWLLWFVIPRVVPELSIYGIFGGLLGGIGIIVWWGFFSKAPRVERWGAVVLMIATLFVTSRFIHVSIATGGQGMMFIIYAIPTLSLAFVLWAVVSERFSNKIRRWSMLVTIILGSGMWTFLRIDGITGEFNLDLAWRWSKTSEELLLAQDGDDLTKYITAPKSINIVAEWPGFRGPNRDGIIKNVQIQTDWSVNPPVELWRRPIGPGCSSFAVSGNNLYTQEQRGEYEMISCYDINTGASIWRHQDKARFWDSHAGAGPRSTPTFCGGRVYSLGATGILNALNAADGSVVWSRNAVSDTNMKHSGWGYTSSPLVVDDIVVVAIVGQLVAYDMETGNPRWFGPDGGDSYSSPHLLNIDGIKQIALTSASGLVSIEPADGTVLWKYSWPGDSRIVQPSVYDDHIVLLSSSDGSSVRRISVIRNSGKWKIEEQWTSSKLKPNFNDIIVHKGHAYGFNGPMLVCIGLDDGERKWRGGRYGGQIILLADQDMLVVLSEKGELALVRAIPDKFEELSRLEAIEGKTWNHPVLVGDKLLIRNSREMVGYRMQPVGS